MKQGILFSVLASLLITPLIAVAAETPDVDIYGRMHFRLVTGDDMAPNLDNGGHRLGFKGEGKLNNGMGFFYQLETEYGNDSDFGPTSQGSTDSASLVVRQANVGLGGRKGSLTIGRQGSPMTSTYTADVFEFNSGAYEQSPYRLGHAIVLKANDLGGFKAFVGAILEGGSDVSGAEESTTGITLGGTYSIAGININAGYYATTATNEPANTTANAFNTTNAAAITAGTVDAVDVPAAESELTDISIGLSYSMGEMYFGLNIESATVDADGAETDTDVIDLAVTYTMDTVTYGLGYGTSDNGASDVNRVLLGAYVGLGGNNDCYIETGQYGGDADDSNIVFGYRVKY